MDTRDRTDLHEFARAHHVHYEVEPEEVEGGQGRALAAVRLRLLATHPSERLPAPGCPACTSLLQELRAFAERVVAEAGARDRTETIPAAHKLYQSTEDRNVDEVALTVRIRCDEPADRDPSTGEDHCLAGLRERLAAVGVERH
jgi:hypothetical protein